MYCNRNTIQGEPSCTDFSNVPSLYLSLNPHSSPNPSTLILALIAGKKEERAQQDAKLHSLANAQPSMAQLQRPCYLMSP